MPMWLGASREDKPCTCTMLKRSQVPYDTLHKKGRSIAPQHALHEIAQRPPEIFPSREFMLVDEEDVVFEASVEVRFESQMHNYWVVVAVNVGVDTVQALEDLADCGRKGRGKAHA